jgi:hypothetical protein
LAQLFVLAKYVCAVGSDNASTPVNAVWALSVQQGIVPFACLAHAASCCLRHITMFDDIRDNVVEKVGLISDLFLSNQFLRALLESNGGSVLRVVDTRFASIVLVVERLITKRDSLLKTVECSRWDSYRDDSRTKPSFRSKMNAVYAIIRDRDAMLFHYLAFFLKLTTGFVVAIRCFDGSFSGSVCYAYKFWMTITNTVALAFKEETNKHIANPALFQLIGNSILKDWKKFHFPAYSAGFVLNHYFQSELADLYRTDPLVAKSLVSDTVDCCILVARRFTRDGIPRENVLHPLDPALVEIRASLKLELRVMGDSSVPIESLCGSPASWWAHCDCPETLSDSWLRMCAIRICSLAVSTSVVERTHKVFKATRTKFRSRLGYARAHGLNFICCEDRVENHGTGALDWKS